MSNYDLSKIFDKFDDAVNLSDFSPEELQELISNYRNGDEEPELSDIDKTKAFKQDYFEYYDDVKDHTNGVEDW